MLDYADKEKQDAWSLRYAASLRESFTLRGDDVIKPLVYEMFTREDSSKSLRKEFDAIRVKRTIEEPKKPEIEENSYASGMSMVQML